MKIITVLAVIIAVHGYNEVISDDHMARLFLDTEISSFLKELSLENLLLATVLNESVNSQENAAWLSHDCVEDLTILANGIINIGSFGKIDKELVIPVLDSTAKIGPGITRGHTTFNGLYPQCVAIDYFDEKTGRHIRGGYFRVAFHLPFANTTVEIYWDVCLPKSCSKSDLRSAMRSVPKIGKFVYDMSDGTNALPKIVFASYVVGFIMLSIITLCVVAGAVDYYDRNVSGKNCRGKYYDLLMVFSIYRNFCDLISVNHTKKKGQVNTIDCIRSISIVWLVAAHVGVQMLVADNKLDVLEMYKSYPGQLVSNGYFAVDSFFFIGGLLLAYQKFKDIDRNPHALDARSWIMFYLHRILRLSPPYYATIFFYTFLFSSWVFILVKVLVPHFPPEYCRSTWWTNILYLNNFIEYDHMCYEVSWYLATDFQIYIFTPILFLPFALGGVKAGIITAVVVLVISTGVNAFEVFYFYLPASSFGFTPKDPRMHNENDFRFWNYQMPYIRCQVVIIGFLVGYLLQKKKTMRINKLLNVTLWLAAFVMMNVVLFGLKDWLGGHQWPLYLRAIYSAFSRVLWAFGLSWIVIACYYGYGGLVNTVMSWSIWTFMARLSYCVYLVHMLVMYYLSSIDYSPIIYSGIAALVFRVSLPVLVLSFIFAAFWTCVFEIPFLKLEMKLLRNYRHPPVSVAKEKPLQNLDLIDGVKNNA